MSYLSQEDLRLQERLRRRRCFADQELLQALVALAHPVQPPVLLPPFSFNPPPPLPDVILQRHFRFLTCHSPPMVAQAATGFAPDLAKPDVPTMVWRRTESPANEATALLPTSREGEREVSAETDRNVQPEATSSGRSKKPALSFSVEAIMGFKK